jgi:hypothetical protein
MEGLQGELHSGNLCYSYICTGAKSSMKSALYYIFYFSAAVSEIRICDKLEFFFNCCSLLTVDFRSQLASVAHIIVEELIADSLRVTAGGGLTAVRVKQADAGVFMPGTWLFPYVYT